MKYLPSPLEFFGNESDECRQSAIQTKEKAGTGEEGTKENAAVLPNTQPANLKNETNAQKHEYDCLIAKYTGNLADFTRWLVAVTLLLAFFGFWQVMVSRDTAKRQLRAYVWAFSDPIDTDADKLLVRTAVKNSGQTPAYDVCCWGRLKPVNKPLPADCVFEAAPGRIAGPKYVVTPGSDNAFVEGADPPLTVEEKSAIKDARQDLYFWGEIQYQDTFRRSRKTKFRLVWAHKSGSSRGTWVYCDNGNDAD